MIVLVLLLLIPNELFNFPSYNFKFFGFQNLRFCAHVFRISVPMLIPLSGGVLEYPDSDPTLRGARLGSGLSSELSRGRRIPVPKRSVAGGIQDLVHQRKG